MDKRHAILGEFEMADKLSSTISKTIRTGREDKEVSELNEGDEVSFSWILQNNSQVYLHSSAVGDHKLCTL